MRLLRARRRAAPEPGTGKPLHFTNRTRSSPDYMRQFGFAPALVIDVGVGDGTRWLYETYRGAKFLLVDPLDESRVAAEAWRDLIDFDFHPVAAGKAAGTAEIGIPHRKSGPAAGMSSLHRRIESLARSFTRIETRPVNILPLDEIAAAHPGRVGLKIDTEGHEYEILLGASRTLDRCDFVVLELSVIPRFEGVPPPSAIMSLLAGHGLELRDVIGQSGPPGRLAAPRHFDALFARPDDKAAIPPGRS